MNYSLYDEDDVPYQPRQVKPFNYYPSPRSDPNKKYWDSWSGQPNENYPDYDVLNDSYY